MKVYAKPLLIVFGVYLLSYFIIIKKSPNQVRADHVTAEPAVRFLKYPVNIRSVILTVYKPLIHLDMKWRPRHWLWTGPVVYEE